MAASGAKETQKQAGISPLLQALHNREKEKNEWVFRVYIKSTYWKPELVDFLRWFIQEFCQNSSPAQQLQQATQVRLYFFFMVVFEEEEEEARGILGALEKKRLRPGRTREKN